MTTFRPGLSSADELPVAHAFWVGDRFGPIDAACLESFLNAGHRVVLHAYEPVDGVPAGVTLSDAAQVLPRDRIVRFQRTGTPALFANIFRYELLRRGADLWIDTDIFCLKPIPRAPYVFGWEHDLRLNNAVLALPPDSELLKALIDFCANPGIPPWFPESTRAELHHQIERGVFKTPEDLPWGSLGPDALTYFAKLTGDIAKAAPMDVYYPLHFEGFSRLLDPGLSVADIVTSRTRTVHFHANTLRELTQEIPPSSPLGRMLTMKPFWQTAPRLSDLDRPWEPLWSSTRQ